MVPQMQGELIDIVVSARPDIKRVCDPFVGSGTILTESMSRGLDFVGCDINPLAILTCLAKIGPYDSSTLIERVERLFVRITSDRDRSYAVTFPGQAKWFSGSTNLRLSKIRRAIESESNVWVRRVFWVTLAETIRRASNSRTSTFKLHVRSKAELAEPSVDPVATFKALLDDATRRLSEQEKIFTQKQVLTPTGHYIGEVDLILEDVSLLENNHRGREKQFDLLITSPPYGDNASTVPYGQFSYLPSQWIPLSELGLGSDNDVCSSTHGIDSVSLGGSNVAGIERGYAVCEISHSFQKCFTEILAIREDHAKKLGSFGFDLFVSIKAIANLVRLGGVLVWTLGNRRISGKEIPLAAIVEEMLRNTGAVTILSFKRKIPSKRMAVRNNISGTMRTETVLIMRMANS